MESDIDKDLKSLSEEDSNKEELSSFKSAAEARDAGQRILAGFDEVALSGEELERMRNRMEALEMAEFKQNPAKVRLPNGEEAPINQEGEFIEEEK